MNYFNKGLKLNNDQLKIMRQRTFMSCSAYDSLNGRQFENSSYYKSKRCIISVYTQTTNAISLNYYDSGWRV